MSKTYERGKIYSLVVNEDCAASVMPHCNMSEQEFMQEIGYLYETDVNSIREFSGTEEEFSKYPDIGA